MSLIFLIVVNVKQIHLLILMIQSDEMLFEWQWVYVNCKLIDLKMGKYQEGFIEINTFINELVTLKKKSHALYFYFRAIKLY